MEIRKIILYIYINLQEHLLLPDTARTVKTLNAHLYFKSMFLVHMHLLKQNR
jgi:hypothetical protein